MTEIIDIDEKTRIRRCDPMNWTVEVLRPVEHRDGSESTSWVGANGQKYGPYFGKLAPAFSWLLDYLTERDTPDTVDMDGYMRAYRRTADRLMAVAKELDR